jgi:secondary thiamine-phosphate synthase enzyme
LVTQQTLTVTSRGRGAIDITDEVVAVVAQSRCAVAVCNVFVRHTSASLIICENADPQVLRDLEAFLARMVPDGDSLFRHTAEGPDDMPSHVRSVLTQASISIPVRDSRLLLGTWQGLYLYEHRHRGHTRQVTVTVQGQ